VLKGNFLIDQMSRQLVVDLPRGLSIPILYYTANKADSAENSPVQSPRIDEDHRGRTEQQTPAPPALPRIEVASLEQVILDVDEVTTRRGAEPRAARISG